MQHIVRQIGNYLFDGSAMPLEAVEILANAIEILRAQGVR